MRVSSIAFAAGVAVFVAPAFAQDEPVPGSDNPEVIEPAPAPIPEAEIQEPELQEPELEAPEVAPAPAPTVVVPPVVVDVDEDTQARDEGIGGLLMGDDVLAVQLGAGQGDFIGEDSREATEWGATWDARAILGRDYPLGLEGAYVGSARGISGFGIDEDAGLLSNGVEGALRVAAPINIDIVNFSPFLFGGMGWEHYTLVGEGNATSGIQNDDSLLTVPLGVGLDFGLAAFTANARATYKHGFDAEMFGDTDGGFTDDQNMNTWNVSVSAGVAF